MPLKDPEKRRAYNRAYRLANLERIAANNLAWHKENVDHCNTYSRARYADNRESMREYQKSWHKKNPDRYRNYRLKKSYGITLSEYNRLLELQHGVCAICFRKPSNEKTSDSDRSCTMRLVVDHCHRTGVIRGLLCRECNAALGQMRDDPAALERAARYLRSFVLDEVA